MQKVNKWRDGIRSRCFPPVCVLCGDSHLSNQNFCDPCIADLPLNHSCCERCALPLPTPSLCGQCQQQAPTFDRVVAPFQYAEPIRLLIHQFKLGKRLDVGLLLAQLFAEQLDQMAINQPDIIIPVPLHRSKLRQRGFNQSVEVARSMSSLMGIPLDYSSCVRTINTKPQSGLSAEQRRKNTRGVFAVCKPIEAQNVAIVDDVMTTGNTVNELAKTLKKAGIKQVSVWVLARANRE